ncbi:MAG: T9SS type A sorting domain-containing protein [Flavobacteriales bacterium]|nr:T9SS type A sorting domain-containing protein [Flavobacteriales bacterium]
MRFLRTVLSTLLVLSGLSASAIQVYAGFVQNASCGNPTGAIDIYVLGGTPPYAFQWSNGATTEDLNGLAAGQYTVTVTDANNEVVSDDWYVYDAPLDGGAMSAQDGHYSCIGAQGGEVQVIEWGINGTPPYSYDPPPDGVDPQGDPYFVFPFTPPGSTVSIQVTDANGCSGTLQEPIVAPQTVGGPNMIVYEVQGSCTSGTGGTATIGNVNDGTLGLAPQCWVLDALNNYVMGDIFPSNEASLTGLAPGAYRFFRNWDPQGTYMAWSCEGNPYDQIGFVIPDLGTDCGSLSGRVFIDVDQDCTPDAGEVGVPYSILQVLPGAQYTITDANGDYHIDLVNGIYAVQHTEPSLIQLCPTTSPAPFVINYAPVTLNLADSSSVPHDLAVSVWTSNARPGFATSTYVVLTNTSAYPSGAVTLTLSFPGILQSPNPANGQWTFPTIPPYSSSVHTFTAMVPADIALLGISLDYTATATNGITEENTGNNSASATVVVTGSYDPNDKTGRTSTGLADNLYFVDLDEWIDYTVRFQNTGTAAAETVVIRDTIESDLDITSLQILGATHDFTPSFGVGRELIFTFNDIDLPDSTSDFAGSQGAVHFRLKPRAGITVGDALENTAAIYFDFNPPIITNTATHVVEISTSTSEGDAGALHLFPVPATDELRLVSASAVRSVEVFSMDGRRVPVSRTTDGRIPIRSLAEGSYFLRAVLQNGQQFTKRFEKR